jgi:hypothetical protein
VPRRVIALLLTGWVLVAVQVAFVGSAGAQDPGPTPPTTDPASVVRDETALEARLEQLESAVGLAEAAIVSLQSELNDAAAAREEIGGRLSQLSVDHRAALRARDDADDLGREVAVIAYMAGRTEPDPVLDMLEAGRSGDHLARRTLFAQVRAHARDQNREFEERAAALADQLNATREELAVATAHRNDLLGRLTQAQRDRIKARDDLREVASQLDRILALGIRYPLTGIATEQVPQRPALAVKIDNAPAARPQTGLSSADIIFEEQVEGNITRFVALFHSKQPGVVGPVRSARTSDFDILANLGFPLFANSGANANVLRGIAEAPVRDAGASRLSGPYSRDGSRRAPHNLYADTDAVWASFNATDPPPFAFEYLLDDEVSNGSPVSAVGVSYGGTRGTFEWDEETELWLRSTDGAAHMDAGTDEQVGVTNVVIQFTEYRPSSADIRSPEAVTVGSGEVWVLSGGEVIQGRWERASPEAPTFFRRGDGRAIRLQPGTTWVALPPPGGASLIR